jgi:hypothetical protein
MAGPIELLIILLLVGGVILGVLVFAVNSSDLGQGLAVAGGILAVLVVMAVGGMLVMRNAASAQMTAAMAAEEVALMEAEAVAKQRAMNSDLQEEAVVISMSYEDVSAAEAESMTQSFTDALNQEMAVIQGSRSSSSRATFKGELSTGEVSSTLYPNSTTNIADLQRAIDSFTSALNTQLSSKKGFTLSVENRFNPNQ